MKDNTHAHAHAQTDAHGAQHAHENPLINDNLSAEFIYNFYLAWKGFEDEIQARQESKKEMMKNFRKNCGRHQAEAMKITMRRALMDAQKRHEATIFNEMASYYVDLLEGEIEARMMGSEPVG